MKKQSVRRLQREFMCVLPAEGRLDTLPQDVVSIPGIEYAITSNGAAVYRIQDKQCLRSYVLTEQSVKKILELTKDFPVTYEGFIRGTAYAAKEYIEDPVNRSNRACRGICAVYQTFAGRYCFIFSSMMMNLTAWTLW